MLATSANVFVIVIDTLLIDTVLCSQRLNYEYAYIVIKATILNKNVKYFKRNENAYGTFGIRKKSLLKEIYKKYGI